MQYIALHITFAVNTTLYMAFVDLEKASDRVPKRVVWSLRKIGVEKWLVQLAQSMCENVRGRVCICCNPRKSSVWTWALTKALARVPYWPSLFWKPPPKASVQDVPGKTCVKITWSSSPNHWRNCCNIRLISRQFKEFNTYIYKIKNWQ